MTKDQKEFEKWANEKLVEYQKLLCLDHFTLMPIEYRDNVAHLEAACHTPYLTIGVRYGDSVKIDWRDGRLDVLTHGLIHELCHSITDPLYVVGFDRFASSKTLEDEREKLTDYIANLIIKLAL